MIGKSSRIQLFGRMRSPCEDRRANKILWVILSGNSGSNCENRRLALYTFSPVADTSFRSAKARFWVVPQQQKKPARRARHLERSMAETRRKISQKEALRFVLVAAIYIASDRAGMLVANPRSHVSPV